MEPIYALTTVGLTHRYGSRYALSDVSLRLPANRTYGFLGRNGAGKTTLLNIASAALRQTSGEVELFGLRARERAGVLSNLCYVRERPIIPPGARLRDVLFGCAMAYPNWDGEYALRVADRFELNLRKKYKQLSRGMESSLGIAIGLASRAPLTIFDEPSLGLDAAAREFFYDELARDVRESPRTVIVSTHLIDEVNRLFEDVVILDRGRALLHLPLKELMGRYAMLTGAREDVEAAARGRRALQIEELGDTARLSVEWDGGEVPERVKIEPVPLQRLFVMLTEGGDAV